MTSTPAPNQPAQRTADASGPRAPQGTLDDLLLHYTASFEPSPIKSSDDGVRIDITIKKRHLNSNCKKIVFQCPVGSTGTDLSTAAQAAKITPIPPTGWTLNPGTKPGEFEAIRSANASQAVTFGWKNIKVNGKPGYFTIAVAETTGRGTATPVERTANLPTMQKVSPEVYFGDFKPAEPSVTCGDDVRLSWAGKTTTTYEIRYDDRKEIVPAGQLAKTIKGILHTTTFLLIAEAVVNQEKHYFYQSLTVPVKNPEQSVGTLDVEKTAAILAKTPQRYEHQYTNNFVASAPTDGFLLLWPRVRTGQDVTGQDVARVIATVYRDAQKSHVVRRTVDERAAGTFSLPSAMCVPLPRGAKVIVSRTGSACEKEDLLWIPGSSLPLAAATNRASYEQADPESQTGLLFDYRYQPNSAVISTSKTTFEFTVDTRDPNASCQKVTFAFPVGDKADDLAATASGTTRKKQWSSFSRNAQSGGKIPFVATPPSNVFAKTPERLTVSDIQINNKEGPAHISVTETRNGQESPPRMLPVYKTPPGLEMSDLAANPPSIPKPGKARVTWKSQKKDGVGFFLKWGDANEIPVDAYQNYNVGPLHRTTTVQLTARRLGDHKDLKVLTTTIDVAHPDITVQDLTVTTELGLLGPTQLSNRTTLAAPITVTASTDGLLVVSALHQGSTRVPTVVCADVRPTRGEAYGARALATTGLSTLPVSFVLPIPSSATVTLKKESGNPLRDEGEITWLPCGSGPLKGLSVASDESTFVPVSLDDNQQYTEAQDSRPPLSDFRPNKLTVANGTSVTLTWQSMTDKHLTLLYSDHAGTLQRIPVTGTSEQVVDDIRDTTAFTLLASTQAYGAGDVLGAVTTTVTVINPTATYQQLTVNGNTTAFGPPETIDYKFTEDYQTTTSTDGFLVGWVQDTSTQGSRVTAEVRHNGQVIHAVTTSTGQLPASWNQSWNQQGTAVVPDNFFLPVPKGAQLTIKKAATSSGTRTCALRWIPIGERKTH